MPTYLCTDTHGRTLRVEHDPDAGVFGGPDGAAVQSLVDTWPGVGLLYGGTQPAAAPDPAHQPDDLAVLLATYGWSLPAPLDALLPAAESVPDGGVA